MPAAAEHAPSPITYVTRKFPPGVGGMEQLAAELAALVTQDGAATVVAWDGRRRSLPGFGARLLGLTWRAPGPGALLVGDVGLAAGWPALARAGTGRRVVVAHGLDVVWRPAAYQRRVCEVLPRFDAVLAISEATRQACLARGVPPDRCQVVPPPVRPGPVVADRGRLEATLGLGLGGRAIVLLLGRLVPRKGALWFLEAVVPRLPEEALVLVAGEGPEAARLAEQVRAGGLAGRVVLLGRVNDDTRALLYGTADALAMPNLPTAGDMEGFGLVAVEAAMAGLPVVAADVEGLRDAVPPSPIAWRVPAGDGAAFAHALGEAVGISPEARAAGRQAAEARLAPQALAGRWLTAIRG
ncbi:MAG: glycosyltransferase family 4 protein [Candidatus Sericytochromatia bacterium]|nr:glycosyltransferase family 4 protein [Candidatus Sericytochromatia bacterium]